ncbi:MAG: dephospho-CoA kinase [Planctomycetota bacterium]
MSEQSDARSDSSRRAPRGPGRPCTVLGLVGGIGSGKSTVARLFEETGAAVLDADAICTELHDLPEVRQAIEAEWGAAVFGDDGRLDRGRLADIVFADPAELDKLNAILHPRVVDRIRRKIAAYRVPGGPELCVIDAPLLVESGLDRLCDVLVFVQCDQATRTRRLADERHWPSDEIKRREAHQLSTEEKRRRADAVICNEGDARTTRQRVRELADELKQSGD